MEIDRELVESALELLEDWLGAECADGCECILHELRAALAADANRATQE